MMITPIKNYMPHSRKVVKNQKERKKRVGACKSGNFEEDDGCC
jgi:hypothetical protein